MSPPAAADAYGGVGGGTGALSFGEGADGLVCGSESSVPIVLYGSVDDGLMEVEVTRTSMRCAVQAYEVDV